MFPITSSVAERHRKLAPDGTEHACYPGPVLAVIERRDLAINPLPVNLAGKFCQFLLLVDILIKSDSKQIA